MKLYVPLTGAELEALRAVARAERRRPQDQAAIFVAKQLREQERVASTDRAALAANK